MSEEKDRDQERNEGEGSKTAARAYNRSVAEFTKAGRVEAAAREAAQSLESEGEALREAERVGKSRAAEEDPMVEGELADLAAAPRTWRRAVAIANTLMARGCSETEALRLAIDRIEREGEGGGKTPQRGTR